MNGVSSNETKYSEELDEVNRMSILTIKSFSVEDLNIPYECVYGFMKYRARLMLKENEYECKLYGIYISLVICYSWKTKCVLYILSHHIMQTHCLITPIIYIYLLD